MAFDSKDLKNLVDKVGDTLSEAGRNLSATTKTVIDVTPLTLKLKTNY